MSAVRVTVADSEIPASAIRGISIHRGRDDELDRHATGTATIQPNFVSGRSAPYGGEIVGGDARIELYNPVAGGFSQLYEGFVDDPNYTPHKSRVVTYGDISCVDGLDKLARVEIAPDPFGTVNPNFGYEVPPGFPGQVFYEDSGQVQFRIEKLLDEAGWPFGKRDIFSGNVSLQEMFYPARTPILEIINDCCEAEFPGIGQFFIDKEGVARFKGRLARFNPGSPQYDILTWPAGVGSSTRAQVADMAYSRPRSRIINAAMFTPRNCPEHRREGQVVIDAGSIAQYGLHSYSAEELQTEIGFLGDPNRTALQETKLFGTYYVSNFAQPRDRVDRLVFRTPQRGAAHEAATWALLCGVDLTHLIDLVLSGPGFSFAESFFVEGITYDIGLLDGRSADVTLTLDLSPQGYYDNNPF